jgi:hypothetical protein
MAMHKDVDTSMLRRAIWNYIHCMFGIRSVCFLNVYKDTSFTQKSLGACSVHVAHTNTHIQLIFKVLELHRPALSQFGLALSLSLSPSLPLLPLPPLPPPPSPSPPSPYPLSPLPPPLSL